MLTTFDGNKTKPLKRSQADLMTIRRAKRNTEISRTGKTILGCKKSDEQFASESPKKAKVRFSLKIDKFNIENQRRSGRNRRAALNPITDPIGKNQGPFFSFLHRKKRFIPTLHDLP